MKPATNDGGGREPVNAYIIVMDAAAVLLLSAVAAGLAVAARRASRGPFRALSLGGAAVCVLLVIASLHHLLIVAAHRDLLAPGWIDWLLGPLAAIQATLAFAVGVLAVVLARHYWLRIGHAHAMVGLLTDRMPTDARARQAGLTCREHEVLALIRRGLLADCEIAEALHISPATAATHVQRILRKTGLHNRRDLMLLPPAKSAA